MKNDNFEVVSIEYSDVVIEKAFVLVKKCKTDFFKHLQISLSKIS